ncbi:chemotaxis protein CheA [Aliikangiella coralliicola]|uniref:Chemotaxis protein CheA n=1 Tax=Aliikangiella coralliicola TaxID=2592383 RepID=A0A545UB84_9GAMM|nr:chemotaxis protein CheA [Aliikangiella coralliicola]TQV86693.1 chemotaxis protein CheA [Aliikangiella coralliicola]
MSFEADEEILQDFLIEAGEILETMSEQLVALENEPEDMDLLNGIFRGFHTVKGGAGFLALEPLVEICHITENIFDILRNGERKADADLMDQILQALDIINDMFEDVRGGEYPTNADPEFLKHLGTYATAEGAEAEADTEGVVEESSAVEVDTGGAELFGEETTESDSSQEEITDDEFDALLDELSAGGGDAASAEPASAESNTSAPASSASGESSDDITDDEFEALLDELHGIGKFSGEESKPAKEPPAANNTEAKAAPAASGGASEDITDDEFEALLDELHGKGAPPSTAEPAKPKPASSPAAADEDLIGDDEFEALLDELHGSGQGPTKDSATPASDDKKTPEVKAEPAKPKAKAKKAAAPAAKAKPAPAKKPKPEKAKPAAPAVAKPAGKKPPPRKAAAPATEATVRVDTKRLDDIMNMVGELVLARNRLKTLGQTTQDEALTKAIANLDIVTGDLQGAVMKTRMQPIKKVFGRFPRVVRDLARSLKKEITLEMIGEETDLDKNLVEALADPLVHLVRNSVDHGIESPEDRVAAGKARNGKIVLSAAQEGDHILLSIEDDGKGMNADVLRGMAVEKGLMDKDHADRLTETECYNLIFMAGFSTKKEISDISGRGVGMDVVKTKITQLNGSLTIESTLGKGTKILIKVPLTLAILPTLMVKIKDQSFALPLTSVNEIFHLDLTKTNIVDGQLVIVVRDKALPLFFLREWLTQDLIGSEREKEGHVVLVQVGTQRVGFVVDSLIGQEEVVIKPLGKSLHGTPGMAGATITSDGGIALIIDIPSLLKHYAS